MTIQNRYDFVMLFDVENGNPNGDPDAGNAPRMDPATDLGYITDVCLKRKIQNYVELVKEGEAGYNILIKPDRFLNAKFTEAYEAQGLETGKKGKKGGSQFPYQKGPVKRRRVGPFPPARTKETNLPSPPF